MRYNDLPEMYRKSIKKADIFDLIEANKDSYENCLMQLDEKSTDKLSEYIYSQFYSVVNSIGLDGPDDSGISADIEFITIYDDSRVKFQITGNFSFCVYGCSKYGESAYSILRNAIVNYNYDGFKVSRVYRPEDTFGIAFNGIHQDEDTVYIAGWYESPEFIVDNIIPQTILYQDVEVYLKEWCATVDLVGPYGLRYGSDLLEYSIKYNKDQLLSLLSLQSVDSHKYEEAEDNVTEYIVKLVFNNDPNQIYECECYNDPNVPKRKGYEYCHIKNNDEAVAYAFEEALEQFDIPYMLD